MSNERRDPDEPVDRWWVTRVAIAAAAVVLVLAAIQLLIDALAVLSHVLLLMAFGVVVAFVLGPLVERLQPFVRRRDLAVALTAIASVIAIFGALALLTVPLVRETRDLAADVPRYAVVLSSDEPISILGVEISGELRQRIGAELGARAGEWSQQAARVALRVGSGIVDFLFVFVLGIYLLASAPRARAWLVGLIPRGRRGEVERIGGDARRLFGAYIRGQLLLGLIIGVVSGVTYALLGVPYAVLLGVLAGIFELVPIIGPVVAGTVAAAVSLTQPFPLVAWVVVAAILIQQLENNFLVPRISGTAVGLHPLAALLAVLVGAEVGGVVGAIFAVPLTGLAWSIARARSHAASAANASGRAS